MQADAGAQAVQIFDSWAAHLAPRDFDVFAGPYIKQIVDSVKATHPDLPLILYISGSGGLLERMAATGVDIISVDGSVDMPQAIQRCGRQFAYQVWLTACCCGRQPGGLDGEQHQNRCSGLAWCNDDGRSLAG